MDMEHDTRIDIRKILVGGLLAWVIQALAIMVFRLP
jgi:hypothetical protein